MKTHACLFVACITACSSTSQHARGTLSHEASFGALWVRIECERTQCRSVPSITSAVIGTVDQPSAIAVALAPPTSVPLLGAPVRLTTAVLERPCVVHALLSTNPETVGTCTVRASSERGGSTQARVVWTPPEAAHVPYPLTLRFELSYCDVTQCTRSSPVRLVLDPGDAARTEPDVPIIVD